MTSGNSQPSFPPMEEEISSQSHRIRFIVLAAVVAVAVGFMVFAAFPNNTQYFLTVGEFVSGEEYQDGQMVRVSGKLVEESFTRVDGATVARFQLADKEGGSARYLEASYVGVMPDLFFNPHSEIILEGHYTPQEVFETDQILVKCPSKYQALEEEQRREEELSTQG